MRTLCVATAVTLLALLRATAQPLAPDTSPRVRDLLNAREFSQAEQIVRGELASSPGWVAGHLLLAQIYVETGKYDAAERSALAAVRIRESVEGLLVLAVATMRMNRLNDSIGWLEKAARLRPDNGQVYKILGMDYALGAALPEAEKAFRLSVRLAPEDWESHYFLGRSLFELRRFDEARPVLERSIQLNGSSAKSWTALGQVQERLGLDAAAADSYDRALTVCGKGADCAWPLLQTGYRHTAAGKFRDAVPYFRRAVEARPGWARTHFHLGKTLAELDDFESARKELEQAIKLDGARSEYHYQLAQVYRRLGEDENAAREFRRFREIVKSERQNGDTGDIAQP